MRIIDPFIKASAWLKRLFVSPSSLNTKEDPFLKKLSTEDPQNLNHVEDNNIEKALLKDVEKEKEKLPDLVLSLEQLFFISHKLND